MRVVIEGLGEDRALRTLVSGKVAASLGRLHVPATTARVQFSNETGAKSGPSARCSLTVDLPRRPELHADLTAESARLAFEAEARRQSLEAATVVQDPGSDEAVAMRELEAELEEFSDEWT